MKIIYAQLVLVSWLAFQAAGGHVATLNSGHRTGVESHGPPSLISTIISSLLANVSASDAPAPGAQEFADHEDGPAEHGALQKSQGSAGNASLPSDAKKAPRSHTLEDGPHPGLAEDEAWDGRTEAAEVSLPSDPHDGAVDESARQEPEGDINNRKADDTPRCQCNTIDFDGNFMDYINMKNSDDLAKDRFSFTEEPWESKESKEPEYVMRDNEIILHGKDFDVVLDVSVRLNNADQNNKTNYTDMSSAKATDDGGSSFDYDYNYGDKNNYADYDYPMFSGSSALILNNKSKYEVNDHSCRCNHTSGNLVSSQNTFYGNLDTDSVHSRHKHDKRLNKVIEWMLPRHHHRHKRNVGAWDVPEYHQQGQETSAKLINLQETRKSVDDNTYMEPVRKQVVQLLNGRSLGEVVTDRGTMAKILPLLKLLKSASRLRGQNITYEKNQEMGGEINNEKSQNETMLLSEHFVNNGTHEVATNTSVLKDHTSYITSSTVQVPVIIRNFGIPDGLSAQVGNIHQNETQSVALNGFENTFKDSIYVEPNTFNGSLSANGSVDNVEILLEGREINNGFSMNESSPLERTGNLNEVVAATQNVTTSQSMQQQLPHDDASVLGEQEETQHSAHDQASSNETKKKKHHKEHHKEHYRIAAINDEHVENLVGGLLSTHINNDEHATLESDMSAGTQEKKRHSKTRHGEGKKHKNKSKHSHNHEKENVKNSGNFSMSDSQDEAKGHNSFSPLLGEVLKSVSIYEVHGDVGQINIKTESKPDNIDSTVDNQDAKLNGSNVARNDTENMNKSNITFVDTLQGEQNMNGSDYVNKDNISLHMEGVFANEGVSDGNHITINNTTELGHGIDVNRNSKPNLKPYFKLMGYNKGTPQLNSVNNEATIKASNVNGSHTSEHSQFGNANMSLNSMVLSDALGYSIKDDTNITEFKRENGSSNEHESGVNGTSNSFSGVRSAHGRDAEGLYLTDTHGNRENVENTEYNNGKTANDLNEDTNKWNTNDNISIIHSDNVNVYSVHENIEKHNVIIDNNNEKISGERNFEESYVTDNNKTHASDSDNHSEQSDINRNYNRDMLKATNLQEVQLLEATSLVLTNYSAVERDNTLSNLSTDLSSTFIKLDDGHQNIVGDQHFSGIKNDSTLFGSNETHSHRSGRVYSQHNREFMETHYQNMTTTQNISAQNSTSDVYGKDINQLIHANYENQNGSQNNVYDFIMPNSSDTHVTVAPSIVEREVSGEHMQQIVDTYQADFLNENATQTFSGNLTLLNNTIIENASSYQIGLDNTTHIYNTGMRPDFHNIVIYLCSATVALFFLS